MTGLLASVRDGAEAALAAAAGVAIIDAKEPAGGALGAVNDAALAEIVAAARRHAPHHVTISATIGDGPFTPAFVLPRLASRAGVDFIKIGVCEAGETSALLVALVASPAPARLIAVLLADAAPDFALLPALAKAGFAGVMLDTAEKSRPLTAHLSPARLAEFIAGARAHRLMCGLAGGLALADVAPLAALRPDVIGLRGALCEGGRAGTLSPHHLGVALAALAAAQRNDAA